MQIQFYIIFKVQRSNIKIDIVKLYIIKSQIFIYKSQIYILKSQNFLSNIEFYKYLIQYIS